MSVRVPVRYGGDPAQFAELYLPERAEHAGTIVIIHGGFWRARYELDLGRPLAADLAAHGFAAYNIEYRRVGNGGGLLKLWELGRKTIIFVTHDITEAIALGDRTLVLSRQPTRIAAEHAIPFPRPRNVQDLFGLEGFSAVYQRIRAAVQ